MTFNKMSALLLVTMLASLLSGCGEGSSDSATSGNNDSGNAGSMARFQIIDNYLYAITNSCRTDTTPVGA